MVVCNVETASYPTCQFSRLDTCGFSLVVKQVDIFSLFSGYIKRHLTVNKAIQHPVSAWLLTHNAIFAILWLTKVNSYSYPCEAKGLLASGGHQWGTGLDSEPG